MKYEASYTLEEFRDRQQGRSLHAVAAIGNPDRFFSMLEQHDMKITRHSFADHHRFTKADFDSMTGAASILMTEKDAVKCRALGLNDAWYVPVDAILPEDFIRDFTNRLVNLTRDTACQ